MVVLSYVAVASLSNITIDFLTVSAHTWLPNKGGLLGFLRSELTLSQKLPIVVRADKLILGIP